MDLRLFDHSYAYFLNIRGEKEEQDKYGKFEYIDFEIENLKEHYPDKYRIATKIKSFLDNQDIAEEKKIQLFREWYTSFKTTDATFNIENAINHL